MIQSWNPASQTATFLAQAEGTIYDIVDDLGGDAARYGSYPKQVQSFISSDFSEVTMYSIYPDTALLDKTNAYAKFGDFTPATAGTPGQTFMSFGEFSNSNNLDWPDVTVGYNYDSYFISGYKVHGEAIRKWQSNYWQVYTRNINPSTFDVYGRWDYANSGNTGRWNSVQRVTQDDTSYAYRTKRLKMRGHGKALQFKVNSVEQEPFDLVGWSIFETANAAP
jgi:hypothetical protein